MAVALVGDLCQRVQSEPIRAGSSDCAGLFGIICGNPIPKWRASSGARGIRRGNVNIALTWRYFELGRPRFEQRNPLLHGPFSRSTKHLGSQNYFDLALPWNINKNFTLYAAACNNIVDKRSADRRRPLIAGPPFGNGNTYPQVYDTLGRNFFLSVTAKF